MRPVRERRPSDRGAPPEEPTADRRTRALEEPLDVRPRPGSPYAQFEVRNPRRRTRYLVLFPEFPTRDGAFCSCEDFGRRGLGTCKHVEAVLLFASENPGEGGAAPDAFDGRPAWQEIDRRLARVEGDGTPDALRYRRPGGALMDRADR